jgi:hypothetical protein
MISIELFQRGMFLMNPSSVSNESQMFLNESQILSVVPRNV